MNLRVEAAARAMSPRVWGPQVWTFAAHGESPTAARARVQRESLEQAQIGLAAVDAVTFSDEAIERASEALYDLRRKDPKTGRLHLVKPWADLDPEMKPFYRDDVRAVVAALRGDA